MWVQVTEDEMARLVAAEAKLREVGATTEANLLKEKIDTLNHHYTGEGNAYREQFVEAAGTKQIDGEIEIDADAIVSDSDDEGEYVLAWVWVTNEEAGYEPDDAEEEAKEPA